MKSLEKLITKNLNSNNKVFCIMSGLPSSGKSTVAEFVRGINNSIIVDPTKIRSMVTNEKYDIYLKHFFPTIENIVIDMTYKILYEFMETGENLIYDDNNIDKFSRSGIIAKAKLNGYKTIGVELKTDKNACKKRKLDCDDNIPLDRWYSIIDQLAKNRQKMDSNERFDEIVRIST
jgi:predicted kinase